MRSDIANSFSFSLSNTNITILPHLVLCHSGDHRRIFGFPADLPDMSLMEILYRFYERVLPDRADVNMCREEASHWEKTLEERKDYLTTLKDCYSVDPQSPDSLVPNAVDVVEVFKNLPDCNNKADICLDVIKSTLVNPLPAAAKPSDTDVGIYTQRKGMSDDIIKSKIESSTAAKTSPKTKASWYKLPTIGFWSSSSSSSAAASTTSTFDTRPQMEETKFEKEEELLLNESIMSSTKNRDDAKVNKNSSAESETARELLRTPSLSEAEAEGVLQTLERRMSVLNNEVALLNQKEKIEIDIHEKDGTKCTAKREVGGKHNKNEENDIEPEIMVEREDDKHKLDAIPIWNWRHLGLHCLTDINVLDVNCLDLDYGAMTTDIKMKSIDKSGDEGQEVDTTLMRMHSSKLKNTDLCNDYVCAANCYEPYVLRWETELQLEVGKSVAKILKEMGQAAVQQMLTTTILAALLSAVALPALLLKLTNVIDHMWTIAEERAITAGQELAEALARGLHGRRAVTLVGHSLGARVVFECLLRLEEMIKEREEEKEKQGDGTIVEEVADAKIDENSDENKNNNGEKPLSTDELRNVIQDVYVMGGTIGQNPERWSRARSVVAGRFVNAYSKNDLVLALVYRYERWKVNVAGVAPVHVLGIEDIDVSSLVKSHADYCFKMEHILEAMNFDGSCYTKDNLTMTVGLDV